MNMPYIKSFTEDDLCTLIFETKESLFICLPLLQPIVMGAIDKMHFNLDGKVEINIGMDFSAETFSHGTQSGMIQPETRGYVIYQYLNILSLV